MDERKIGRCIRDKEGLIEKKDRKKNKPFDRDNQQNVHGWIDWRIKG